MKKRTLGILLFALMAILVFTFVGCVEPAKSYEVKFEVGEGTGTAPAGASYEAGATVTLPDATGMSKDGYHFKAWNDGSADYAAGATYKMPATAVTFTAVWEEDVAVTYPVEYKAGEGSGTAPAGGNYEEGATFTLPAATELTKLGSHFKCWNDGTADYAVGATYTMPAKAVTFTAIWEANVAVTYPVEYNKGIVDDGTEEGKVPEGTAPATTKYAAGETFTLPDGADLTLNGYRLIGWDDGSAKYPVGATYKMPQTAVYFTAIWVEIHTVTFEPNNDGTPWQEIVVDGDPVAKPAEDPTIESGKIFRYWADENGEEYSFDAAVTADITLYAKYAYKLTFVVGEGVEGEVEPRWVSTWMPAGIVLPDGTGLTHSEGKIFIGWTDESNNLYKVGDRFVGTANHTLTAVWKAPAESVTVSFETNRYATGDSPASIEAKKPGEEITLPQNTFTANVGYEFNGWYVKGQSSSTLLQPGDKYTIPADYLEESLVFIAKFDKGNYTITYKAGDHATGADIVENKKGGNVFLLEPSFTPEEGYVFNGWKLEGGTEDDVYAANDKYELGVNTVFIAQWLHVYGTMDNAGTTELGLYLDFNNGYIYDYNEDLFVDLIFTLDGTSISITLDSCEEVSGTLENNVLNIALTYNGKTYTFGTPAPVVTECKVTYKAGDHGTGANIEKTINSGSEITLLELSEITFTPDGYYTVSGWKIEGETDGKTYEPGSSYTVSVDTVFVAQWEAYYAAYSQDYNATIILYLDRSIALLYVGEEMPLTLNYALNGTDISMSINGGETFNGTYDNNGLSITISYNGTHVFAPEVVVEPTEPTIVFEAGEGTGNAPTATVTYNSSAEMYKVVLPENTFVAPEGKEFKCWSINGVNYQAGKSYMAESGETVTVIAVWQDAAPVVPAFEGTVFVGNCTTPAKGGFLPSGGETYTKLIISTDKTKVQYTLSDGTEKEVALTDECDSNYKPQNYGSDAYYYSVKMEKVSYYLLVSADMSKLYICNSDDEVLDGGEFIAE